MSGQDEDFESILKGLVGPGGGLADIRLVGKFLELMETTQSAHHRTLMMQTLRSTSSKPIQQALIQQGGVEILRNYLGSSQSSGDWVRVVLLVLQFLGKLPITKEIIERTEIGKSVNYLKKAEDPTVQQEAKQLVAKWETMIRNMNEAHQTAIKAPPKPKEFQPVKR